MADEATAVPEVERVDVPEVSPWVATHELLRRGVVRVTGTRLRG
jgi:hypothetical protein